MDYELHITRATNWADNTGREIDSGEWLDLVARDGDLKPDPSYGEFAVLWTRTDDRVSWFDWCNGNVYTANPDREALGKSLEIAQELRARVQGDDDVLFVNRAQELPG